MKKVTFGDLLDTVGTRATRWFKPMPEWELADGEFHLLYPDHISRDTPIDVSYCTFHHGNALFDEHKIEQIVLNGDFEQFKKKFDFFRKLERSQGCEYLPSEAHVSIKDETFTTLGTLYIACDADVFRLINWFECEHG